jgi:glucokinase
VPEPQQRPARVRPDFSPVQASSLLRLAVSKIRVSGKPSAQCALLRVSNGPPDELESGVMPNDKKRTYWLGFDLGGTKMLATVFDPAFKTVGRSRKKATSRDGSKTGLERMVATVEAALDASGIRREQLAGIGVGIPGPLDLARGVVLHTPNLGWHNFQLRKPIEEALGCKAFIINDVDAGVYGEYRFGAAQKARCAVGVFPGTGIGGGCVYAGQLLVGRTRSCFEIGHLQMIPDGPLCGCGQRGCLESIASRLAISASAASAVYRGEAPNLQAAAGTDLSNIRSGALAQAIAAGDRVIEDIVRNAARWLGVGVSGVINLLVPDVVVLGGGLVEAMPQLYLEEVTKVTRERAMPAFRGVFDVVVSKLGDDAVAKGAAAWAQENVESGGQK